MDHATSQAISPTVGTVADLLERWAPLDLAAEWDNVGLLLGDRATPVDRLMTCLTVTPEVAAEAVAAKVQLIVTHHPIFFRAVQRLTTNTAEGRMALELIHAGVAVYSPHTAFDNSQGGINDLLARKLELVEVKPLRLATGPGQCKIVVFVPEADLTRVTDALFAAGAGNIGQYSQCSFRLAGTGTFFGSETANPTVGQKGRREEVGEWRLEAVCPEALLDRVIAALRRAHSYEEPAYDVYPLSPAVRTAGEGRLGRLPQKTTLESLGKTIKAALRASFIGLVGAPSQTVERVAIACGAAGEFLNDASRAGADVFLTGEMRFHDYLSAQAQGMALALPGHYATERIGIEDLADRLQNQWPNLQIWASRSERDPVIIR